MKNLKQIVCLFTLTVFTNVAFAQNQQGSQQNQGRQGMPQHAGHHMPPKEALDACQGKKAGDTCTFQSPHGSETGTCFTPESSKPLACKPAHEPQEKK